MLLPMQPWGRRFRLPVDPKALGSAHLDWLMLAFMEFGAAFVVARWPVASAGTAAWLLVYGGWMNPVPYVLRGMGINAFAFAGGAKQRISATIAGSSALAILVAWIIVVSGLLRAR
jgi:hypothetical protein